MADYKKLYSKMFNKMTDMIREMQDLQTEVEEAVLKDCDEMEVDKNKTVLKIVKKEK